MPLNLTDFNHFYIINKVCGLEKQRHYLEALGRKEFQIYFQPKISGKSQKIAFPVACKQKKRRTETAAAVFKCLSGSFPEDPYLYEKGFAADPEIRNSV